MRTISERVQCESVKRQKFKLKSRLKFKGKDDAAGEKMDSVKEDRRRYGGA